MALAALKAGKHCICEKPLAMNTRETAKILKRRNGRKTVFAVNYNVRFYPAVLQLRKLMQRGELGGIIHVNGLTCRTGCSRRRITIGGCCPEGGKLRAVADIGTHWMDTVSAILGARQAGSLPICTWHKTRKRPLGEVQTFAKANGMSVCLLQSRDGRLCQPASAIRQWDAWQSTRFQVAAGRKNCIRIEVYGSKKSAWWCSENPELLEFGSRDPANQTAFRATPAFGDGASGFMDYPPGHVEGFPDTFKMLFRNIIRSLRVAARASRFCRCPGRSP